MSSKLPNASKPYCLFRNSKVGIAICDINTNCISLTNPTFATIFEKQEEELIGQSLETLLPEHTYIHLSEFTNPKFSNIGEFSFETTYYKKSGFGAQLFIHITLIKDNLLSQEQGEIIVHVTDFGNNQCLRDELLTLTENLPGFAYKYQWDMTTGEEKFLYASKGVSDIYGVSVHEALNNIASIRKVMHPEDLIPFKEAIVESSITLAPFHQEFRVNHPEKGLLWLETKSVPKKNLQNNTIIWHGITVDVTEQKIAEKKLKESEKKYRTLVENAKIPIYRFDKNFKRAYVNSEVEKLVGKSYLELIGKSPFELKLIEDESIDDLKKAFDKVFKTKQMTSVELKFILANNSRKYFMHNLIPEFDNNGEVESILAISIDLTAQKELAQKEEMFRTLAENSPNIIMRYDTDVTRIYANPAFSEQTGIPLEAVSSFKPEKQWGVFLKMLNMSALEYQDRVKHVILTGEKDSFFVEWKRLKDGKIIAHDLNIVAERNCEGKIIGALAIGHNITERKLMLDKLISKEQEFRTLTENLPDNVVRFDKEGNYIYLNSTMEQTLGVKSSFIIGKNIKDIVPQHTEVIKAIKDVQNCENDSLIIHQVITTAKGDTQIHHIKFIVERDKNGNIVTVLGVGRDITKTIELQEALQKSEKHYRNNASLLNSVLESSHDVVIFALDREYKYLTFNQSHLNIMKLIWNCEVAVGTNMLDCISCSEEQQYAKGLFDRVLEGESFVDEAQYGDENLSRSYWETHYSPIFSNDNNEIIGLTCYNINVTERKLIENALVSKEQEFRSLTKNLPDNVIRWDKDGNYLYLNPTHEQTLGVKAEDIRGKSIKVLFPHHTEVIGAIEKIQRQESDSIIVHQSIPVINGTMEIHEVKLIGEKNEQGKLISILGIGRDITKIISMQEELSQALELRRGIINSIPDLLCEINRYGEYLNFWFHDKKVMKSYRNRLIGKNIKDVLSHQAVSIAFEALEEADKNGISLGKKYSLKKNDNLKWYELSISKKSDGNFLVLAHEITTQVKMQEELSIREKEFRTLAEHTPDTIARYNKDCIRTYVNPAFCRISGKTKDELLGKKPTSYNNSLSAKEYEKKIKEVFISGKELEFELFWKNIKDETITSLIHIVPEYDDDKNIGSVLATGRDITKLKTYEEVLKQQKDFQDSLLKGVAKAGMSVNVVENGKYIYTNNQELAIEYGYDESISEINPSFLETIHPDDKEKVALMHQKRLAGEDVPNTYTITQVNKQGERREHEVSVVLIPNTNPIQTLVVTKDVTEQKNIEKRIEFMAHHDILTELPNRLLAKDRAIQALSRANRMQKKVGFLFIDLDNFKTINDSLGHSVGDELLKIVASRLQKCIRASDTISRQGGDEFIIILPDLNSTDEIFPIANKLIVEFKKIFDINNQTLSTTASIGVAVYPEHGDTFEQLLQNADAAMYKAKENGRNTYCVFTQQMKHNMLGIFKMQNDLNEAIEKKEFILHYQPQIDLTHNTIVGVEALIRWKHPLLGMIPPLNFISIAESSGIIVQIGEWVLQEACKQAAIWNKEGKNIVVAVNISAVQFKRGNLVEVVKNALKISGLNPQYLELELTESILISDTESVLNTVKIIKEMGVLLSIDDFGTGYSSLAYLKRFAVDKLKIDQSFVRDIVQDKDDATIVKTIIAMAKSFNLKAIAEGVENEAVLSALHEFGCDEVQGYYFAKPMIAHEFENYYEKRIN